MAITLQKHTIAAFYETRDLAESAAAKLRQSGVAASDVTVSPENAGDDYGRYDDDIATTTAPKKTGFWASLEEMFGGADDHQTYAEGVRRGHVLLTAHVTDAQLDGSIAIIEEHGSIDLDEHEETWRSEGWTGVPATNSATTAGTLAAAGGAVGLAMTETTQPVRVVETETVVARAPAAAASTPVMPMRDVAAIAAVARGGEDVLQVVEERLAVGKRAVSRGKVRLHSYVVETEVSEDVHLRDETVTIDRHAVDRPVAALDADLFRERTIEMEEIDEEAVVAKTARVVEEIGIRKDVSDRTETVHDTVRSTKVDIEDSRVVGTSGVVGAFIAKLVKDMEVVGSDGVHVGTIDHVEGDSIKLKRMDPTSGGTHHRISTSMVTSVDRTAVLSMTAKDAMTRWTAA